MRFIINTSVIIRGDMDRIPAKRIDVPNYSSDCLPCHCFQ